MGHVGVPTGRALRASSALAAVCAALLIGLPPARAQITDCSEIMHSGDKIVVDSVRGAQGDVSGVTKFRLQAALDMKVEEVNQELHGSLQLVFCDARWPGSADGFDRDRSELLN